MHNIESPDPTDPGIERQIQTKGLTAPRVTPADLQANIAEVIYFTAAQGDFGHRMTLDGTASWTPASPLHLLTFCVIVLRNGFTVTGESACASPENFDADIGRQIALENAKQKIWPLMGYQLKEQLFEQANSGKVPS